MAEIKIGGKTQFENIFTKTIIPFALVGYEVIITNSRYALVGYFITSYPTRAHRIIDIYTNTTNNTNLISQKHLTKLSVSMSEECLL